MWREREREKYLCLSLSLSLYLYIYIYMYAYVYAYYEFYIEGDPRPHRGARASLRAALPVVGAAPEEEI